MLFSVSGFSASGVRCAALQAALGKQNRFNGRSKVPSIACIERNAKAFLLALIFAACSLTACTRAPARLSPLETGALPPSGMQEHVLPSVIMDRSSGSIEEIAVALIRAERNAVQARDLATLAQLWASNARIIDRRGSHDLNHAYVWEGRDAILDRYLLAVFPAPPPPFSEPIDPIVHLEGDTATATLDNDRWQFVFREGRWWLKELSY